MADDEHEWGALILHDGKGCPVTGEFCEVHCANGDVACGIVHDDGKHKCSLWNWANLCFLCFFQRVVAYRVRKNRHAQRLCDMMEEIVTSPAPVVPAEPERVDG